MAESSNPTVTPDEDDLCLTTLFIEEERFQVSDENYAEELQLQEVIISSLQSSLLQSHETTVLSSKDIVISTDSEKFVTAEIGESSGSLCQICIETKPHEEMFRNENCSHVFCSDCISKHIAAKIQQNITMVECPYLGCQGLLEPEFCRAIIPVEVFERWENGVFESMVFERFYCPFKDCSAIMVDDGGVVVTQSECPECHRLFCAQCKVAWHSGVECEEFQSLNRDERGRDDLIVMELAKSSKWKRCPRCRFYVEKNEGCQHITCRCGLQFCYGCGASWNGHGGCASA
ncbi:E3 ubiquitin-protein ligase RSL1-like [Tasmannia lanceolata]|uniref:E3 ubiquitin-protein ligase RSL1-like n=1 Tax=Tasmannia lanceolata TaxID=3420 RepID=UPI004063F0B9